MPPGSHFVLLVGHILDNPSIVDKALSQSNCIKVRSMREESMRGRLEKRFVIRE